MDRIETFNGVSHLAGAILALLGFAVLMYSARATDDGLRLVGFSIYGLSLCLLYAFSACYHIFSGRWKNRFRALEHQAIYLLIAGTYTPFTLLILPGELGWRLFGSIWAMALLGIMVDLCLTTRRRVIPTIIYMLMGWLVLVAWDPLLQALPDAGFRWLLAGGLCYTAGVVFFALSHWFAWSHAVWHVFVLAGSVSHYFAVLYYV